MIKHLITATSFALGGAGVALVAYLATKPYAFTHSIQDFASKAVGATPIAIHREVETSRPTLVLAEVRITASRAGAKRQVLPARLDPCSEWSDEEVPFVEGAAAIRQVRTPCVKAGDER